MHRQLVGKEPKFFQRGRLLTFDAHDLVANGKVLNIRRGRQVSDGQRVGRHTADHDQSGKYNDRQREIEQGTGRNRGRARPKRGRMHRGACLGRRHIRAATDRCGIAIAQKLDIAPKRNRRDLPARAMFVGSRPKHGPETDREHFGFDTCPASDDIMAIFMNKNDDQKRHKKCSQSEQHPAKRRDQRQKVHSVSAFLLAAFDLLLRHLSCHVVH